MSIEQIDFYDLLQKLQVVANSSMAGPKAPECSWASNARNVDLQNKISSNFCFTTQVGIMAMEEKASLQT